VDDLEVRLIGYPEEEQLKRVLAKMVLATTGSSIHEDVDPAVAEELFQGGLQTGLEAYPLVFEISGCSRALTHELVRTRKGIFHQQSMRHTDMGDQFNVRKPVTIEDSWAEIDLADSPNLRRLYEMDVQNKEEPPDSADPNWVFVKAISVAQEAYALLKRADIPYQDARFICPIGTQTYIVATYPVKVWLDTFAYRACNLMMWEIVWLFRQMKVCVLERFPWMEPFIKISCEKSNKCTFQGWEATAEQCDGGGYGDGSPFPWAGNRTFVSKHFSE
jgi:thymidylate synthase (FAD)